VSKEVPVERADGRPWLQAVSAEVDFIIQRERSIIPIEVKSADNTKAKSLGI